ncbi:MAG: MFS transporter, partial [Solimonas sp.]
MRPASALPTTAFAVAAALSVANVYYAQPLLDTLAAAFGIAPAAVGGVVTATQLGCALALLFVVPLGDIWPRRRLMRAQLVLLVAALLLTAMASTPAALLLGMLATGLLGTACTQGFIAYAAALAPPASRGRIVGTVQAGVMVGLLGARVLSGAVADLGGWRAVYLGSAALMLATLLWLWRRLPAQVPSPPTAGAAWWRQPLALLELLAREHTLQVRGTVALLLFAALSILWSALALVLAAPPYGWSHTAIGALGLVGVAGALGAARAGRWAD